MQVEMLAHGRMLVEVETYAEFLEWEEFFESNPDLVDRFEIDYSAVNLKARFRGDKRAPFEKA